MLSAFMGCAPELDPTPRLLDEARLIAVQATPAEQRPGRAVRYEAVVVGPAGERVEPPLAWSFCLGARALTDEGPIDPDCLRTATASVPLRGVSTVATASLAADVCRRFGPDPPPGEFRAQDPDETGGYHQPVLIRGLDPEAVFGHRIRCGLARAPVDLALRYEREYVANSAPGIQGLGFDGARVTLELEASARESFPVLSPRGDALVTRTERLAVSWWVTAGEAPPTRAIEGTSLRVDWAPPPGAVLWAVVRDDRGAASVARVRAP